MLDLFFFDQWIHAPRQDSTALNFADIQSTTCSLEMHGGMAAYVNSTRIERRTGEKAVQSFALMPTPDSAITKEGGFLLGGVLGDLIFFVRVRLASSFPLKRASFRRTIGLCTYFTLHYLQHRRCHMSYHISNIASFGQTNRLHL